MPDPRFCASFAASVPCGGEAQVYIDTDGEVQPGLAASWRRISPLAIELTLRRWVRFHDGAELCADDFVATLHAHKHPSPSATGRGVLGPRARAEKLDAHVVCIISAFPDAMLLRRLSRCVIYPHRVLETHVRDALMARPVGTGPYRLAHYQRGREIVLERHREHWGSRAGVDMLRFPILRQNDWVEHLGQGEVDCALNLDVHERIRAERVPGLVTRSRPAAVSQWFLLASKGPLCGVRRAMNHALNIHPFSPGARPGPGACRTWRPRRAKRRPGTGRSACGSTRASHVLSSRLRTARRASAGRERRRAR